MHLNEGTQVIFNYNDPEDQDAFSKRYPDMFNGRIYTIQSIDYMGGYVFTTDQHTLFFDEITVMQP